MLRNLIARPKTPTRVFIQRVAGTRRPRVLHHCTCDNVVESDGDCPGADISVVNTSFTCRKLSNSQTEYSGSNTIVHLRRVTDGSQLSSREQSNWSVRWILVRYPLAPFEIRASWSSHSTITIVVAPESVEARSRAPACSKQLVMPVNISGISAPIFQ